MDETYTPPTQDQKNKDKVQADAARRIVGDAGPNYTGRRFAAGVVVGAVLVGSLAIVQSISNETKHDDRVAAVKAEYEHNQDILHDIEEKAASKVDPANVVGSFNVKEGTTVNQLSIDIVDAQSGYIQADQATKQWIHFTILKSGEAQGIYNVGDNFVVSHAKINDKNTFIVQDGSDIQLTSPSALYDPKSYNSESKRVTPDSKSQGITPDSIRIAWDEVAYEKINDGTHPNVPPEIMPSPDQ